MAFHGSSREIDPRLGSLYGRTNEFGKGPLDDSAWRFMLDAIRELTLYLSELSTDVKRLEERVANLETNK